MVVIGVAGRMGLASQVEKIPFKARTKKKTKESFPNERNAIFSA